MSALGLRQGELLALRWRDVDLDGGTLAVAHTLARGSRTLAEPKTERAKRTLRLGAEVLLALREQRRRQLAARLAAGPRWRDQGYARAGLPRQRFHDLLHATATLLLESGEELGVVSKVLGHSSIGTTANVCAQPHAGHVAAGRGSDGQHHQGYGKGYGLRLEALYLLDSRTSGRSAVW